MCGGFKPSRKFAVAKDEQISREMARLARLEQNQIYSWPLSTGIEQRVFAGHARIENLDSVWNNKIDRHVRIEAESFGERDTVGGSMKLKDFSMPEGKAIHGIILKTGDLRIVTRPAVGEEAKVHNRAPHLVNIEGSNDPIIVDNGYQRTIIQI